MRAVDKRSFFSCVLVVLTLVLVLKLFARHVFTFTWLAYLGRPAPGLWDWIHGRAGGSSGGVWQYDETVHSELVCYVDAHYTNYSSLLDVASNLGFMLARLRSSHPTASHSGTDISASMAGATRARCGGRCATSTFDLHRLLDDGSFVPGRDGVPAVHDIVVVSDVLYFVGFGGWPPLLLQLPGLVPDSWLRDAQKRFFKRLRSLASVEVVFSSHQLNRAVLRTLGANGVVVRRGVFSLAGTARPARPARAPRPWWARSRVEQRAAGERFARCLQRNGFQVVRDRRARHLERMTFMRNTTLTTDVRPMGVVGEE